MVMLLKLYAVFGRKPLSEQTNAVADSEQDFDA
jgi:hypothetical protein